MTSAQITDLVIAIIACLGAVTAHYRISKKP